MGAAYVCFSMETIPDMRLPDHLILPPSDREDESRFPNSPGPVFEEGGLYFYFSGKELANSTQQRVPDHVQPQHCRSCPAFRHLSLSLGQGILKE